MESFVGWMLASSVDDGRRHSLAQVRTLAPAETRELDASLRLLWWMTNGSRWNSIPPAWTSFQQSLVSATTEPGRANQALFRLLRSLAAFSEELAQAPEEHRNIAEELARRDPSGWLGHSRALTERAPADPPVLIEVQWTQVKPGQSKRYASLAPAALGWLAIPEGESVPFPEAIEQLVRRAQLHHAFQLVAFSDAVTAASLVAKRYASEVALGRPVLMRPTSVTGDAQTFDLRDFALENVNMLAVALNRARQVTAAVGPYEPAVQDLNGDAETTSSLSEFLTSTDTSASEADGAAIPAERSETAAPSEAGRSDAARGPDWSAVDPVGLFRQASRMSDAMEERWSDALSEVVTDELLADELAQWHSLLISEWGSVSRADDDTTLSWPLGADAIVALTADDPARAAIAYLAVLANLSSSLRALELPTNGQLVIEVDHARLHSWWSSGGFAAVSAAADMMLRTAQDIGLRHAADSRTREAIGIPPVMQAAWPELWLDCARRALTSGLPEAALIYCLYAYDSWTDRPAIFEPGKRQDAIDEFETLLPAARRMASDLVTGPQSAVDLIPVVFVAVESLSVAMTAGEILIRETGSSFDG